MKRIILASSLIFSTATLHGQEGAAFLKLGTGARAAAMGGAFTALGDDASVIGWNPAGLARLEKREFNAAHAELQERTRLDFATYAHPIGERGTIAAALLYLSHGSFTGRDGAGRPTGSVTASDAAITGAYAIKAGFADIGVGFKFITSHIAESEARTTAVDLGLKKQVYELKGGKVFTAVAARNLGKGLKYNGGQSADLPLQLAGGAAWVHEKGAASFDLINGPRGAGTDAAFGGEYRVLTGFAFRAGYSTANDVAGGSGIDAARGLSFGIGVGKDGLSVDYAIVPSGELGAAHRFGLGWRF